MTTNWKAFAATPGASPGRSGSRRTSAKYAVDTSESHYYGEAPCTVVLHSSRPCGNKAYFRVGASEYACGTHMRWREDGDLVDVVVLPKNPNRKADAAARYEEHRAGCDADAAALRDLAGEHTVVVVGRVAATHLLRRVDLVPGWLNVFPNHADANRWGGLAFTALSPARLGPVDHLQPGLPPAACLSNFCEANMVWPWMLDADGELTAAARAVRLALYQETTPYQRQYKFLRDHAHLVPAGVDIPVPTRSKNRPAFVAWVLRTGEEVRLTELEFRQVLCTLYERLATATAAFADLRRLVHRGLALIIRGPDGAAIDTETVGAAYADVRQPFGHERTLWCLLYVSPDDWPWRRFKTIQC